MKSPQIKKYLNSFRDTAEKFRLIGHNAIADELINKLDFIEIVIDDYFDLQNICNVQSKILENYENYSAEIASIIEESCPDIEPTKELKREIININKNTKNLVQIIFDYERKSIDTNAVYDIEDGDDENHSKKV